MRTLSLICIGLWMVGCGTSVIGEGDSSHAGGRAGGSNGGSGGGGSSQGGAATGGAAIGGAATGGAATGGAAMGGATVGGTGGSAGAVDYCGGMIVEKSSSCAVDDAFCFPLSNGAYCTGGALAPCPDGTESMSLGDCPASSYWCWRHSMSTACRLPMRTQESCVANGGEVQTDPGGGSLLATGCAAPLVNLGLVDASVGTEGGICCGRGKGRSTTSRLGYCGGKMVETAAQCALHEAYCNELSNGMFCTGPGVPRCPPSTTMIDSSECPDGYFWCWQIGYSKACRLPTRTMSECIGSGGIVFTDPGDGSVMRDGCAAPRIDLGLVTPGGEEGAVCCSKT